MAGKLARVALVIAAIGLPLQMAPAAHAEVTIDTKPVIPSANGLVCTVVNVSQKPMRITAQIIDNKGINVTDFITTNWLDPTAGILASVVSRSRDRAGHYCRITITGGRKRDVTYSLEPAPAQSPPVQ